jgi:glycerol dehydrogenase
MKTESNQSKSSPRDIPPKVAGGPGRYIQGAGALDLLSETLKNFGNKPLIVSDDTVWSILGERITSGLEASGLTSVRASFGGESSYAEIDCISKLCRDSSCNGVVGLGGGKALDTAKAVATRGALPVIIAPTIASTDAPTSRIFVIYDDQGALVEVQFMPFNPSVVLVDTQIIANAPVRFLIAGIGDALPTKFEAEQSSASGALNMYGSRPLHTGLVLADTCYQLIRQYGVLAKQAVERNLVTEAVELVVEANIYLSGLGVECGGLSAAHALTRGFSATKEMHGSLHGEEVAFGLLVQLVLENRDRDFLTDFIEFYRALGLPCTLGELGLNKATDKHLQLIAERTCYEGSHIYKMVTSVDEKTLIDAILFADALGKQTG